MYVLLQNIIKRKGEYQEVKVFVDSEEIASIATDSDSPEDNTLSRMDAFAFARDIIKAIDGEHVDLEILDIDGDKEVDDSEF